VTRAPRTRDRAGLAVGALHVGLVHRADSREGAPQRREAREQLAKVGVAPRGGGRGEGGVDRAGVAVVARAQRAHERALAGQGDVAGLDRERPREGLAVRAEEGAREVVAARGGEHRGGVLPLERLEHLAAGDDRAVVLAEDAVHRAAEVVERAQRHGGHEQQRRGDEREAEGESRAERGAHRSP
jgi:hypothetical protein